ncbi:hypothetical protein D3C72_884040 [compost metagenome]
MSGAERVVCLPNDKRATHATAAVATGFASELRARNRLLGQVLRSARVANSS